MLFYDSVNLVTLKITQTIKKKYEIKGKKWKKKAKLKK
jgi:hypothetical protein